MTQSLRALLASDGVSVHGVVLGPVDTDMNRNLDIAKASPESAAAGIFDGLTRGEASRRSRPPQRRVCCVTGQKAVRTADGSLSRTKASDDSRRATHVTAVSQETPPRASTLIRWDAMLRRANETRPL
jgi:NAD(P)-dependent dehydrogenase (short-subunit alcohol dehydrogenase family)